MRDKYFQYIYDISFVKGYAWRQTWACLEPTEGNYDFSGIDYMINLVESYNKSLSISFGVANAQEPDYIINTSGVTTYTYIDLDGNTITRAVPWDLYLIERFQAFLHALSEHQVPCASCGGPVPFREHPSFTNIRPGIAGVNHLRDRPGEYYIKDLPGYSRENLTYAVYQQLRAGTDNFPDKKITIPMWKIQDGASPESWEEVTDMIVLEFNGVTNPKVGFFMENLAASKNLTDGTITGYPNIDYAAPMYRAKNHTYTEFQALTSWANPFGGYNRKVENAEPRDGIDYAQATFNTRYFELYVNDLLNATYQERLDEWAAEYCTTNVGVV